MKAPGVVLIIKRLEQLGGQERVFRLLEHLAFRLEQQKEKREGGPVNLTLHFDGAGTLVKVTENYDGRIA